MILDRIVESTRIRVEKAKLAKPQCTFDKRFPRDFAGAIRLANAESSSATKGLAVIAEIKKASPSKGIIDPVFDYLKIAKDYKNAGATAISVLTEPDYFCGSNEYLSLIRDAVDLPILRKDFTIDEYQIFEALSIGADAVLLIVAILDKPKLKEFLKLSKSLGLAAIVETHDAEEVYTALDVGAEIIGVNNRNLKTFEVDVNNGLQLRGLVPKDKIFISESGIENPQDIRKVIDAGSNAALIGEMLMRAEDKAAKMKELFADG